MRVSNYIINRSEEKPAIKIVSNSAGDTPLAVSVPFPNDGKTFIGEGVVIEGNITGSGDLIIEGWLKGNVELEGNSIIIGAKGRIEGEIIVKDAVIIGQMNGKIIAVGMVRIARHADFCGEIKAKNISIDDGAFVKGKIELDREPNRTIETTDRMMFTKDDKQNGIIYKNKENMATAG
jgi:cytoskeletal protein CcmA (bactofilin family)